MLIDECLQPPSSNRGSGHEGVDVTDHTFGRPAVQTDDPGDVGPQAAFVGQLDRRKLQPLLEDVRGRRMHAAGRAAADIGDMNERPREVRHVATDENRLDHGQIVGVDPAAVGVVHDVDVAIGPSGRG